jgi:four helix bundle protein
MTQPIQNFRDLIVWQKAMKLAAEVYHVTRSLPIDERFGLTSQLRRAAVSIPSNIAEGHARQGREFAHFLSITLGSAAEVETQLLLAVEFEYLTPEQVDPIIALLIEVRRMSAAIINRITAG